MEVAEEKIKAFVSWSGGKETSFACYKVRQDQNVQLAYLLNMVSSDGSRSRSHGIGSDLLKKQAQAIGIPIIQRKTTWGSYEEVFKEAVLELKREGVRAGVFGDIDLQEHRDWVERVCGEMGIRPILPLWGRKREDLLKEIIDVGFKAIVVATRANLLGKEWLGRTIDNEFVSELGAIDNIDLCGENGEYHTFVYDGPIFKKPVRFIAVEKILEGKHWFLKPVLEQRI